MSAVARVVRGPNLAYRSRHMQADRRGSLATELEVDPAQTAAAICDRLRDQLSTLLLPEREADPLSLTLGRRWAETLGLEFVIEDIGPMLEALGCYCRRNEAIRRVVPQFEDGWRCKVVVTGSPLDSERLNVPYIAIEFPDGSVRRSRLPA